MINTVTEQASKLANWPTMPNRPYIAPKCFGTYNRKAEDCRYCVFQPCDSHGMRLYLAKIVGQL